MSDTPLVTSPSLFAIAKGGCPLIINADKRTVRLSGNAPFCLTYSATIEYSRVGSQNDMFGRFFAI
jgi:hypothetical protein